MDGSMLFLDGNVTVVSGVSGVTAVGPGFAVRTVVVAPASSLGW